MTCELNLSLGELLISGCLNRELIPLLDEFESLIIVVGGQALYYWIDYYYDFHDKTHDEQIESVDIDYVAKLNDARKLPKIWNVDVYNEAKDSPPPSLATILLRNKDEIKNKDGSFFIDTDEYLRKNELKPNIVDIIDRPTGFSHRDFTDNKKIELNTECFEYPKKWQCPSNPKLRILNPVSCLKSRLSNISAKIKDIQTEKERIKAIRVPIHAFLEQKFKTNEFRAAKKYMDYFLEVIESSDGLKMETLHAVSLLNIVKSLKDDVLNKLRLPEKYLSLDLQNSINRIDNKISKKMRVSSK